MSRDHQELARLAALRSYQVLDRPRPVVLDDLTRLAANMFDTPISAVSLIDHDRQWFAGRVGLAESQTPLDVSFCAHVVPARAPLIVPDATKDSRFADYANVAGEPGIRFYAGAPVIDEDGHVLGAMCVVDTQPREVSDRQVDDLVTFARQAAGHLSALRGRLRVADLGDELARSSQREDDLVATITHELRTPVAIIQGYLEVLGEQDGLEEYRRLIDPIHRNGRRLVEMVDHILAGTRPAEAPIPAPVTTVDLNTVAAAATAACRSLIVMRGGPVDLAAYEPVPIQADLARLTHAVEQLLRNALFFTPPDRPIMIRIEAVPAAAIEVRDGGCGIPEDELPLIFDRFFRGRRARENAVPGVGLGLTIARNIVRAHHGDLIVQNTADGVCARIALPGPSGRR
ncbi:sensor histidine kinase [Actinoplanes sp. OR16]|uniref:GAF domain-containing sensor histidine kinase n=1 Tax=Actinoplanes sp. OR16 TaxID=946334 RepID=UPI000F6F5C3A|nr:GAF domain-containing sensor histidine kinase [Actinoplanes sp. OR16]BBH67271.1 sensor histidine kinase [Actinoplanes sp. OR16]